MSYIENILLTFPMNQAWNYKTGPLSFNLSASLSLSPYVYTYDHKKCFSSSVFYVCVFTQLPSFKDKQHS